MIVTVLSAQNNERWTSTQREFSLEPSVVPEPSTEEKEGENQPSVRDTKRACGEPEQDLSGEIPVPSADETVDHSRDPLLRHLV